MPPSAPNSLGEIRLERLRRLAELKARKAAKDAETVQNVAARFPLPGDLAKLIDPTTVVTPALQMLDANLLEIAEGKNERLIFSLPPQEGKSQRCSRYFPLWMLLRDPQLRIVIASYELGVARRWSRAIRNDIADHPELGLKLREDTAAAHEWQLMGHRGGLYAVGVGGGLTGRPADCCYSKSEIITSAGLMTIADLVRMESERPWVLSWNHHERRTEWRTIEATRVIPERELVEVSTSAGRTIKCTPDHCVYTATRGYIAAADLRPGDGLVTVADSGSPSVSTLSEGLHQSSLADTSKGARDEVVLLSEMSSSHRIGDAHVRRLWYPLQQVSVRGSKGRQARMADDLLHEAVSTRRSQSQFPATVPDVRYRNRTPASQVLLHRVFESFSQRSDQYPLCILWEYVRHTLLRVGKEASARLQSLLFATMHGNSILREHDATVDRSTLSPVRDAVPAASGKPKLLLTSMRQSWLRPALRDASQRESVPRTGVPEDAGASPRTGQEPLRGVSSDGGADPVSGVRRGGGLQLAGGAPHQSRSDVQQSGKFTHSVQGMSPETPRIDYDTVSVVRRVCGPGESVYDLQIEGNHNFFADGILVSNCLIIDDPTKGRAEADSEAYQENSWEWWTETARTRLAPHAPVIVVQTRWHQLDLAGRLIEQDHNWRNINIPAQCEADDDPLGREQGEYLTSARGRTPDEWQQIQREVGDRAWSALYQGRPAPAEGGMFKRSWWQYDETPVCYRKSDGTMHAQGMDVVIQSWDMTFKNTDGTDFVVGQVWSRAGATAHLLDQVRARMDFPQTCVAVEELSRKWPQATLKLIEDKANGPAVISQLRKTVPGMVPVNPEGNKQARANAVTPYVEAGNVCLPMPARAPWIGGLIEESAAFPNGAHDDQVDALTQALARLMLMPSSTAFLEELVNQR